MPSWPDFNLLPFDLSASLNLNLNLNMANIARQTTTTPAPRLPPTTAASTSSASPTNRTHTIPRPPIQRPEDIDIPDDYYFIDDGTYEDETYNPNAYVPPQPTRLENARDGLGELVDRACGSAAARPAAYTAEAVTALIQEVRMRRVRRRVRAAEEHEWLRETEQEEGGRRRAERMRAQTRKKREERGWEVHRPQGMSAAEKRETAQYRDNLDKPVDAEEDDDEEIEEEEDEDAGVVEQMDEKPRRLPEEQGAMWLARPPSPGSSDIPMISYRVDELPTSGGHYRSGPR